MMQKWCKNDAWRERQRERRRGKLERDPARREVYTSANEISPVNQWYGVDGPHRSPSRTRVNLGSLVARGQALGPQLRASAEFCCITARGRFLDVLVIVLSSPAVLDSRTLLKFFLSSFFCPRPRRNSNENVRLSSRRPNPSQVQRCLAFAIVVRIPAP